MPRPRGHFQSCHTGSEYSVSRWSQSFLNKVCFGVRWSEAAPAVSGSRTAAQLPWLRCRTEQRPRCHRAQSSMSLHPGGDGSRGGRSVRTGISCCCPSGPAPPRPVPLPAAHLLSIPRLPPPSRSAPPWGPAAAGSHLGGRQGLCAGPGVSPGPRCPWSPARPQTITRRARGRGRGRKLSPPGLSCHSTPPATPPPPRYFSWSWRRGGGEIRAGLRGLLLVSGPVLCSLFGGH